MTRTFKTAITLLTALLLPVGAGCLAGGTVPPGTETDGGTQSDSGALDTSSSDTDQTQRDSSSDTSEPATGYDVCILGTAELTVSCPSLTALEFGTIGDGQTVTRAFRVENEGTTSITVESVEPDTSTGAITIEPFELSGSPTNPTRTAATLPKTLAGGERAYFDVSIVGASDPGPLPAETLIVTVGLGASGSETADVPLSGEFGGCPAGTADCDGDASNGCEADITTVQACGSCDNACDIADGSAACNNGACEVASCNVGFDDCDGDPTNGCEANLSQPDHCGSCGNNCTFNNAQAQCSSGQCQLGSCDSGFSDCDSDPTNGCEADLSTAKTCGSCALECLNANGTTQCNGSSCAPTCDSGSDDCDGDPSNGCEADLSSSSTCGSCSNDCGSAACVGGQCEAANCGANFEDCDGDPGNGCETDLRTASNCGSCGNACSFPAATASCVSQTCQLDSCQNGYCDENGQASDGCEVDLDTDPTCSSPTVLGSVSGDTADNSGGANFITTTARGEQWFRVKVEEQSSGFCDSEDLCVTATLDVPSGTDYDLEMHCDDCNSSDATSVNGTGQTDTTGLRWEEDTLLGCPSGSESGRDVFIKVTFYTGTVCTDYTLTVEGDVCPSSDTCSSK